MPQNKDKRPLHTKGHYRQEAPIDAFQFLRSSGPYRQGALADKKRAPTDQGPLFRQGTPTDAAQFLQIRGPIQTKDPYIIYMQGCKGFLQTMAPSYKQGPLPYIQTMATYRYAGRP